MIRFTCPSCGMALSAPEDCAGRGTKCRGCNRPVIVPQQLPSTAIQKQPPKAATPVSLPLTGKAKKAAKPGTEPIAKRPSGPTGVSVLSRLIRTGVVVLVVFPLGVLCGLGLYAYLQSRDKPQPSNEVTLQAPPQTTVDSGQTTRFSPPANPSRKEQLPPSPPAPVELPPELPKELRTPLQRVDQPTPPLSQSEKVKNLPGPRGKEPPPPVTVKIPELPQPDQTPVSKPEKQVRSEPTAGKEESQAAGKNEETAKKKSEQEKPALPKLDSNLDGEDAPRTVTAVGKRIKEATEEELRKQLLVFVPEMGLNQELAANMYSTLIPKPGATPTTTRRSAASPSFSFAPPADYGAKFYVQFVRSKGKPELAHLPWRTGADCQLGKEPAENLNDLSVALRACLGNSTPAGHVRPDAETLRRVLFTPATLFTPGGGHVVIKPDEWRNPAAIPALMQLLQVENASIRSLLVELLKDIEGKEASEALAQRVLFDLSPQVRAKAVEALANRPMEEYQKVLLAGFRYPWPAAAVHAANALMDLKDLAVKDKGLVPAIAELLKEPNPRLPFAVEIEKKSGEKRKVLAVRELVRINHMSNCMVCHAPSSSNKDMVRGRVPIPNEDPPPLYYAEQSGQVFVRADTTFLRQDFSVVQPVARSGKWPGDQRFDYVTRVRPVSDKEKMQFEKLQKEDKVSPTFVQKEALLFTLRELTGKNPGSSYKDWKPIIKAPPEKSGDASQEEKKP